MRPEIVWVLIVLGVTWIACKSIDKESERDEIKKVMHWQALLEVYASQYNVTCRTVSPEIQEKMIYAKEYVLKPAEEMIEYFKRLEGERLWREYRSGYVNPNCKISKAYRIHQDKMSQAKENYVMICEEARRFSGIGGKPISYLSSISGCGEPEIDAWRANYYTKDVHDPSCATEIYIALRAGFAELMLHKDAYCKWDAPCRAYSDGTVRTNSENHNRRD